MLASSLRAEGLGEVFSPEEADLLIVNSCSFLTSAVKESVDAVMVLKNRFPDKRLLLTGCLPGRFDGEHLKNLLPEADGIVNNARPEAAIQILPDLLAGARPVVDTSPVIPGARLFSGTENGLKPDNRFSMRTHTYGFPGSTYLKLAEGCDNRCTYCAIPSIRGPLVSRTVESVLEEFRYMLGRGYVEFNLVAQDLGSFGTDRGRPELPALLKKICEIEGDFWVRLLYIHPDHFPDEILNICGENERMLPYFDLPFQHASEAVLKGMGRRGSAALYLDLIGRIRKALPAAVVRSAFIVGFPGEGSKEFRELLDFQEKAQLDWAGVFIYSREEGTPAFRMRTGLKQKLMSPGFEKRKAAFESAQETITGRRLERYIGKTLDVLIEEPVLGEDLFLGRAYLHAPEVDGAVVVRGRNLKPGHFTLCGITGINGIDLSARPVSPKA